MIHQECDIISHVIYRDGMCGDWGQAVPVVVDADDPQRCGYQSVYYLVDVVR
jgi:hypothetical protein